MARQAAWARLASRALTWAGWAGTTRGAGTRRAGTAAAATAATTRASRRADRAPSAPTARQAPARTGTSTCTLPLFPPPAEQHPLTNSILTRSTAFLVLAATRPVASSSRWACPPTSRLARADGARRSTRAAATAGLPPPPSLPRATRWASRSRDPSRDRTAPPPSCR